MMLTLVTHFKFFAPLQELPYQITKDQLAYLQLSSETAIQKLVISCQYYDPADRAILLGDNNQPIALNGTDSVLIVIDVLENSCSVSDLTNATFLCKYRQLMTMCFH